jgi:HlyD family secretion protein
MSVDIEGDRRRWQGRVDGVAPAGVGGQVTTRVRFTQDKPTGLRQNQRLLVRILVDRRENALMVDRGSFIDQSGATFAYVVHGDVAEHRAVQLGETSLEKVEILGGLNAGDRIVISGGDAFDGASRVVLGK